MVYSTIKGIGNRSGKKVLDYVTRHGALYEDRIDGQEVRRVSAVGMPDMLPAAKDDFDRLRVLRGASSRLQSKQEAYHFVQSFDPRRFDETKSEDVKLGHEISRETAERVSEELGGVGVFVATHTDGHGHHLHSHFVVERTRADGSTVRVDRELLKKLKEINDEVMAKHGFEQKLELERPEDDWRQKGATTTPRQYVQSQLRDALLDASKEKLQLKPTTGDRVFEEGADADRWDEILKDHNLTTYRWRDGKIGYQVIDHKAARAVFWDYTTKAGETRQRPDHFSDRQLGRRFSAEMVAKQASGELSPLDVNREARKEEVGRKVALTKAKIDPDRRKREEEAEKARRQLPAVYRLPPQPKPRRRPAQGRDSLKELEELYKHKGLPDSVRAAAAVAVMSGMDTSEAIAKAQEAEAVAKQHAQALTDDLDTRRRRATRRGQDFGDR